MNIIQRLYIAMLLAIVAPNVFASISCGNPKLSKPVQHGSVYYFKAVVTCDLIGETIDIKTLKDTYRDEILSKGSQFVVHGNKDYDNNKGMKGYSLDTTQSYDTEHGKLAVRANILLLDDSTTNFYLELRSKSIVGLDDATYNKSIVNEVKLQHFPEHDVIVITKEIEVEQPWYAPEGAFFNKVETELAASIRKSAMLQARKIRGDKVDALRK